ncbi:Beta-ureidopropionase (fragment) [Kyrpidia spormannii]|uniref:Beta-ureidopropionase n=1 Tax=Kyrpidia spormannii TaxID=2055160 RepID=A0ACA8ZEC2_9BACL
MQRFVKIGLIQAHHDVDGHEPVEVHKVAAVEKHIGLIREAAAKGAQIVCLQELFYGPYFCTEQNPKWYAAAEPVPDGPTVSRMRDLAKELGIVLIVPLYEMEMPGCITIRRR